MADQLHPRRAVPFCLLLVVILPVLSQPLSWLTASWTPVRTFALPWAVLFGAAALLWLAHLLFWRQPVELPRALRGPFLLWGVSLLVSVRFSQQPHLSVAALPAAVALLGICWLGTCCPADRWSVVATGWVAVAAVVALNGLVRLGSDPTMLSTIGNQNVTAAYLAAAVPLAVALRRRWSYGVGGLLVVALWFCQSRGAWLALGITALAGVLTLGRSRRTLTWLALLVGAFVVAGYGARLWRTDVRPVIWHSTVQMIAAQPLVGHGVGTYLVQYPQFRQPEYFARPKAAPVTDHAHNELLEITAEQGFLGLIAALWLVGAVVVAGGRTNQPLRLGLCGAVLVLAVHGLLDVGLRHPPLQPLLWLLLGLLAGPSPQSGFQVRSPLARGVLAALVVAGALAMIVAGFLTPVRASWWERQARLAAASGDHSRAIHAAGRAIQLEPFRPQTRFFLAHVLAQISTPAAQDAAIEELQRLQALAPDYANVPTNLGALLLARGRVVEAIPWLQRAVTINPRDATAAELLRRALTSTP